MALGTIMVEIPCHMVRVCRLLEVCLVTLIAISVHELVVTICMTRLTLRRHVSPCQREPCCAVVKCRCIPIRCRVTLSAIMIEISCHVVRICRLLEIRLVALIAIVVHQLVVPVRVAGLALSGCVRSGQGEPSCAMVEGRRCPVCRGMALCTIMVEISRDVVWIRRLLEVRLMTLVAIAVHQLVIPVRVARLALRCYVGTCQWESCSAVVKCRCIPIRGRVALSAIMVEIPPHVVWIRRLLEVCLVTLIAVVIHQLVVPIGVARLALRCHVGTCQWKSCCAVVKCRCIPIRSRVALSAIMIEIPDHMIWVRSLLEVRLMTLVAIAVHQMVIPVRVARLALRSYVRACQGEGRCAMIKCCVRPVSC